MVPIYKPYMPENLMGGVKEILYSGQLGFGEFGKQFEQQLKTFIGCEYLLSINSYNTAMQIVLATLGLKSGDEIIASPVSCLASNQPFAINGLKIIWADIDPKAGTMRPDDVSAKITKNTKAIFHNHFCGYLGNIDAINAIGVEFGIPVIDDGIEAFGSEYKGNKLGNVGSDITVFSFQTVRLPNTIDGGAIVFKSQKLYEKARLIRDYGIDRSKFRTSDGEINPDCNITLPGFGGLMSELNSFIGTRQMQDIEHLLSLQTDNAEVWKCRIVDETAITPLSFHDDVKPNYWVFGLLCKNKKEAIHKFKAKGFYATGVHINNNIYSIFNNHSSLKGVDEFMKHYIAIPSGWWVNL